MIHVNFPRLRRASKKSPLLLVLPGARLPDLSFTQWVSFIKTPVLHREGSEFDTRYATPDEDRRSATLSPVGRAVTWRASSDAGRNGVCVLRVCSGHRHAAPPRDSRSPARATAVRYTARTHLNKLVKLESSSDVTTHVMSERQRRSDEQSRPIQNNMLESANSSGPRSRADVGHPSNNAHAA